MGKFCQILIYFPFPQQLQILFILRRICPFIFQLLFQCGFLRIQFRKFIHSLLRRHVRLTLKLRKTCIVKRLILRILRLAVLICLKSGVICGLILRVLRLTVLIRLYAGIILFLLPAVFRLSGLVLFQTAVILRPAIIQLFLLLLQKRFRISYLPLSILNLGSGIRQLLLTGFQLRAPV